MSHKNLTAGDIMTKDLFSVPEGKDLNFVEVMAEIKHIRHIPVVDENGRVTGMVSTRDILKHLSVAGARRFIPVEELVKRTVVRAAPEASLSEIAELMRSHDVSSVVIESAGAMKGIVTERDFLKAF